MSSITITKIIDLEEKMNIPAICVCFTCSGDNPTILEWLHHENQYEIKARQMCNIETTLVNNRGSFVELNCWDDWVVGETHSCT